MQFRVFKGKSKSRNQIATRVAIWKLCDNSISYYFNIILSDDLPVKTTWRRRHFRLQGGSRESDVALSHSSRANLLVLSFYHLLSFCFTFVSSFCYFVSSFCSARFVVLHRKLGRERRGALSFALKRETCGEINRRRFL